ncbi:unnamed protein product [marine sediment metagenome]|uniref:Uncharacterized protein n=1 Tax=marine sediment metagenome TaxID=412755 RepID=X1JN95_9ZZZZ
MWRCVNDIFSYCSKEPVWAVQPQEAVSRWGNRDVPIASFIGGLVPELPKLL